MSSLLDFLHKIDQSETQSLRINVPAEILAGLRLDPDGTVDLEALMQLCQRLARVKKMKSKVNHVKSLGLS
jgi:hypothetical protein